jgi:hypothetical protein
LGEYVTKIRQKAFANRIEEYLTSPASFEERRFDASLYSVATESRSRVMAGVVITDSVKVLHGLCFGPHIELVMILLAHAYDGLRDDTRIREYSREVSRAMQGFAEPLADGDLACYPNPSFLLHGTRKHSLGAIINQLVTNGRIIHETMARRAVFIHDHGQATPLGHGLKMLMEYGATEDCYGICCFITREDEANPRGTDLSYIAKVSFFLDGGQRELYVITIQGQRVTAAAKERSRDFARLAARLGMDPRTYVLKKVCQAAKSENFQRARIIRPRFHPMFIDSHAGFKAQYEPVIRQAGINDENGCYLEGWL